MGIYVALRLVTAGGTILYNNSDSNMTHMYLPSNIIGRAAAVRFLLGPL